MLKLKQVVNRVFTSNTFIVFDEDYEDCWLVDIGDYERMVDALPKGKRVKGLLLTHTHFDHIYGINELCRNYPNCVVYTSEFGEEALLDDKKNLSRYHDHSIVFEGKHLKIVNEGDVIPIIGDRLIKVVQTPGHDPGCLTYYTDRYIFTGDSYIPGAKVITKLPRGNKRQAAKSIERILDLAGNRIICPGHGEMTCV